MKKFFFLLVFFLAVFQIEAHDLSKRALVAGGAGFLGSHLCERLIKEGYTVICLDNLYTGSLNNIRPLLQHPQFTFVQHDVTEKYDPQLQIHEIYNLACPADPDHYQVNPIATFLTSIQGAHHLLELAKKYDAKIFQASTSEIYGDPLEHPQTESYWGNVNPIGIRSCYDEGKRGAETLFFDYYRMHNVKIKVARIFNTYGPRMSMNDGRAVSNFIVHALQGKPIPIYGTGKQTRSFCYVDDLIKGIRKFMDTPDNFTGPLNLGNPEEYTMIELAEKVIALTNSKSTIQLKPLRQDDPRKRHPNISKAKKALQWEPQVHLKEGLEKTILYFKEALQPSI